MEAKTREHLGFISEGVCGMGRLEARKAYTCHDDE
jgi:hypothetical protein